MWVKGACTGVKLGLPVGWRCGDLGNRERFHDKNVRAGFGRILAGVAAPAYAQMRDQGVYEMVTTHQYENTSFGTSTARYRNSRFGLRQTG